MRPIPDVYSTTLRKFWTPGVSTGGLWKLQVSIHPPPLEETTLNVITVRSLCLPWTQHRTQLIEQQTCSVSAIYFHGQILWAESQFQVGSLATEGASVTLWLVTRILFLPWCRPFFWYMLLGNVSRSHSDGRSILSCWDGVSCSLYSQKYLRLPLFREVIALISFKSSTESFSYPKRMHCIVHVMFIRQFLAF